MEQADEAYFLAWMEGDNVGMPSMPYLEARKVYKYRVFRDAGSNSEPITEAMTYQEASRKLHEIIMLTRGSQYVGD